MTTSFIVPDVHCDHCVAAITSALGPIEGVGSVAVDLESKTVSVEHERSVARGELADRIEAQGYEVTAQRERP